MDANPIKDEAASPENISDVYPTSAQSQPHEPHVFSPLDHEGQQFRLFKLESTKPCAGSMPRCTMKSFSIDSAPPFKAVSYTWGDVSDMKRILVNGQSLEISENLFDFLGECQSVDNAAKNAKGWRKVVGNSEEWLWADQICIDQGNVLERNHQVTRMGLIYSSAMEVVIWLGKSEEIARAIRIAWPSTTRGLDDAVRKEIIQEGFRTIASHRYWTRLWIIQEFVLAQNAVITSSAEQMSAETLRNMVQFNESSLLDILPGDAATMDRFTDIIDYRWNLNELATSGYQVVNESAYETATKSLSWRLTWRNVMGFAKSAECRDIRDRVFGMLSLVRNEVRIGVDYQASRHRIRDLVIAAENRVYQRERLDGLYSKSYFEAFIEDLNSALELGE